MTVIHVCFFVCMLCLCVCLYEMLTLMMPGVALRGGGMYQPDRSAPLQDWLFKYHIKAPKDHITHFPGGAVRSAR